MIRAATSVEPPGGNGTISVIGRDGKLSARADEITAMKASAIAAKNFRMVPAPMASNWRSRIVAAPLAVKGCVLVIAGAKAAKQSRAESQPGLLRSTALRSQ